MTFSNLGLTEQLLRAVSASGYTNPTPIQQQAIPAIINGEDVLAAAQTGTGKTASFTLPLLQHLAGRPAAKKKHVLGHWYLMTGPNQSGLFFWRQQPETP